MTVSAPPRVASSTADREALIEEARARQRRRWLIGASLVFAGVLAAVVGIFLAKGAGGSGLERIGRAGPLVDLSAMRHQGELAFVSRGALYLVDGSVGTVHEIPVAADWTAADPRFSHDGHWIAYQVESPHTNSDNGPPELWIARADGSDRHQILGADGVFGWSPSADLLAVSTDTRAHAFRGSTEVPTRVDLISPPNTRRSFITLTGQASW